MKNFFTLLLLVTILAGTKALAVTPHFGATVSGVLTSEVQTSASTTKFVSIPVNDATIANALFKTGTSGVLKAADMAIVFSATGFGLTIINTSNDAVLYQLAVSGSNKVESSAILAPTPRVYNYTLSISDIEFTIPTVTGTNPTTFVGPIFTNWAFRETIKTATPTLPVSAAGVINGGSGDGGNGSTIFRGSVFYNGRKY